jgi:hypothetical protein
MTEAHSHRQPMQADDAQRIIRLSEEVRSRLAEIGMIVNRTAGAAPPQGQVLRFVAGQAAVKADAGADAAAGDWMEIIEVDGVEACYGVIGGHAFAESPCGATIEL